MRVWRLKLILCISAFLLSAPIPTPADTWLLPKMKDYFSSDNVYLFKVVPRELNSSMDYFMDNMKGRGNPGQRPGGQPYCKGTLAKRDSGDLYLPVWTHPLRNDVAPVSALVSTSGDYVVTFDNWHAIGDGSNVVIIYGPEGKFIREFGLADLMPKEEIDMLTHTASSIWWGRDHYIDESGNYLVLRIVTNREMPYENHAKFRLVRIELATGIIVADESSTN